MKYKAIIFDMDGTIIDTSHIWSQVNKVLIEKKGIQFTKELQTELENRVHGLALDKTCKIIKDITKIDDSVEHLMKEKMEIAVSLYEQGIKFIEGFEKFHNVVLAYNLSNAIATNADDGTLKAAKTMLNLDRFFGKHIYSIAHVDYICKPDPAIYLYVANQLKLEPEECLAIEDSAHGIAAAKAAGMYCIGINTSRNLEQVKHSDHIVQGYHDIDIKNLMKKS